MIMHSYVNGNACLLANAAMGIRFNSKPSSSGAIDGAQDVSLPSTHSNQPRRFLLDRFLGTTLAALAHLAHVPLLQGRLD